MIDKESQHFQLQRKIFYIGGFFAFFYLIILTRAYQLQILGNSRLNTLVQSQYKASILVQPKRGAIFDRNGEPLAMDVRVASIGIHPRQLDATEKPALREILKKSTALSYADIDKKMASPKKFEWIERRIPLEKGNAIAEKKYKGVQIVDEFRRYYPNKNLAGQLLGAVGYDAKALGGLELYYDGYLKSDLQRTLIERDARGQFFRIRNENENTNDLFLTLDINIQHFAEQALNELGAKHNAKNGFAIVMDVKTGEVLAMANYPSFNPNTYWRFNQEYWKNHAVIDVFEPGSTFKAILMAAALGSGKVKATDNFFCENGALRIGKHTVKDHGGGYGTLTAKRILQVSSNIGVTKIAQKIGKKVFYDFIKSMHFGETTKIGFKGEGRGSLKDWRRWMDIEFSNIAFGQGVSVTGLQMAAAYNSFANEGEYIEPRLLAKVVDSRGHPVVIPELQERRRLLSKDSAADLKDMLHAVTQPGGTAVLAHVQGYLAGGKTGTAQKVDPVTHSYASNQYVSSFIGFAPLDEPQIVVYVVFDTPRANGYYGGVVAAPAFRNIVENTMGYLGIPPRFEEKSAVKLAQKNDPTKSAQRLSDQTGKTKVLNSYTAAQTSMEQNTMPDLKGLGLRTLLQISGEHDIKLKVNGSGYVSTQSPKAGEKLGKNWAINLTGM